MDKKQYAFLRAWKQVRQGDVRQCREEVMKALRLTTRMAFLKRLNGEVEPRVSEAKAIESIFAKYGIEEVWGE